MISGGKPEGYMNQQVKLHNELARKIKQKYPEVTHLGFN
jgi:transcriptional antiterminator